ncbi:Hypothetical protein CAP_8471 [Chondromyces apiculatus DSM 436]|uniref:Uncharacterized protein n=1 Tax=Chondromyces apiculatus DSM 436 TaxID=1192034 RepID=A0A017SX16_9BACT|nr:Hypothetical protein CAP_8471 [Chondromyces apiculatus DSM 436]
MTPKDFQQPHAIHQVIGTYEIPSHLSRQQFIELREALYRVYDLTMPAFRSGPRDALPEVRDAARSFLQLFPQVAEQPLLLYYQAAGREFFAWLRAIISA